MLPLFVALASAGKWSGVNADVVAETVVHAELQAVRGQFLDLGTLELYPDECTSGLVIGEPRSGYGAPFRIRYHAGVWTRFVEGKIDEVGPRHVDLDHTGKFGFVTRYELSTVEGGTRVVMTTFLDPPVWPFKGPFYTKVRPAWTACHAGLLAAVKRVVEARAGEAPTLEPAVEAPVPPVGPEPAPDASTPAE